MVEALRRYEPARGFDSAALSLAELGRLLHHANGVTGAKPLGDETFELRAAPSAGALYAGEVYVLAERVRGLPPGVYYYAVAEHELVALRGEGAAAELDAALEQPAAAAGVPAVFVLTNVFERYARRYANRAYRYALIDSGHIGENLRLAAVSAGLVETGPLRFHDDRLNALLGVDGRGEAVCALHAVGRPGAAAGKQAPRRAFVEKQRVFGGWAAVPGPVTERYHEATKLVAGQAPPGLPPADLPPADLPPAAPSGPGLALPRNAALSAMSVEASIAERRSAQRFRKESLRLEELGFVLHAAAGHPSLRRAPGVDVYVAAHRVEGLEPGLYRYEPRSHRLTALRRGDLREPMVRACLGQRKADAS